MKRRRYLGVAALLAAVPASALADASAEGVGAHGLSAQMWLLLAALLVFAKLGAEVSVRLGQPPVLGEIFAGAVLGNLHLAGVPWFEGAANTPLIELLAEIGVVLLLFEVGLETTLVEMKRVAGQSGTVAVIGVVLPMVGGYFAGEWLLPEASSSAHLFIGATLAATSVGITARVLQDLGALERFESKVILGAAVIDDVLGLLVLAVVSAIARTGTASLADIGIISATAFGFLAGAIVVGLYVMPGFYKTSALLKSPGVLGALSLAFCFALSGASAAAGLAAIVGAFAAGLVLDEVHVQPFGKTSIELAHIVKPIVSFLAPIFFVRTGMLVDVTAIEGDTVLFAVVLTVIAIIAKVVAGLGVPASKGSRLLVGIGMIPRGEVGLIFANVGAAIVIDGKPIIGPSVFGAIVVVVMVTTIVTPPLLAWQIKRLEAREQKA